MYDQIVTHQRVSSTSTERRHALATTHQSDQPPQKASIWPLQNTNLPHTSNIAIPHTTSNYPIHNNFLTPATYDDSAPPINSVGHVPCSEEAHIVSRPPDNAQRGPLFDYLPATGKDQPHHQQGDPTLHDTGSLIDQLASSGDGSNEVDRLFPFEGYNVEDLWNWMLYFDGPQPA